MVERVAGEAMMHWVLRGLAVCACVVAAVVSARDATIEYWIGHIAESYENGHAPTGVPGWVAANPRVQDVKDEWAFWSGTPGDAAMPAIAANAKAVLRIDPMQPAALYELGMVAERRQAGSGKPLFELSARLSRREALNELALEGLAADSGDNAGAIAHIDRVVTVVPDLLEKILAPLVPAIADPAVLNVFMHYADRPWYSNFIWLTMKQGGDPDAIGQLIRAGAGHLTRGSLNELNANLVNLLVSEGNVPAANRVFQQFAPDVRTALGKIGFVSGARDPILAPLSWATPANDAVDAQFDGENRLSVAISPEQAATAARRMTLLSPGTYAFTQTFIYENAVSRAGVVWDVVCANASHTVLWHQAFPAGEQARATAQATIAVPDDCGAQVWNLEAVGVTGSEKSTVTIADLRIQRQ